MRTTEELWWCADSIYGIELHERGIQSYDILESKTVSMNWLEWVINWRGELIHPEPSRGRGRNVGRGFALRYA